MTPPLVPAEVDLRDFAFMPVDAHRLLTSETWVLGSGDERAAAMTLWLVSWHQVPAASLPDNDRMLAHLSQCKCWAKVRAHVLRGWIKADDGRLYHPVVAEKALEAWLEKLAQRLSSGAGNAKRWGVEFDPSAIEAEMQATRGMLSALNPQSRQLSKRRTSGVPKLVNRHPVGTPVGIPSGSQETETGTETSKELERDAGAKPPADPPPPAEAPTPAGKTCLLLRSAGVPATNPSHPDLLALIADGCQPEEIADTARELIADGKPAKFGYVLTTVKNRRERPAAPAKKPNGSPTDPRTPLPKPGDYTATSTRYDPSIPGSF